jgi:hypothetical protein
MANSCLQHRGIVVSDIRLSCATHDHSNCHKVGLLFQRELPLTTSPVTGSLTKKATTLTVPLTSLKHSSINALSFSTTRSKDWDDILTGHSDEANARTWSMLNKRLGQHAFGITEKGKTRTHGVIKASPLSTLFPQACLNQW